MHTAFKEDDKAILELQKKHKIRDYDFDKMLNVACTSYF
jgi:hypothetical protein